MTDSLVTAGVAVARAHGFVVSRPDDAGEPPALARPDSTTADAGESTDSDDGERPTESDDGDPVGADDTGRPTASDDNERPTGSGDGDDPVGSTTVVGGTPPDDLFGGATTVAVEPIREPTPTTVLSRLWNDRNHDRAAVFVAPTETVADRIVSLLSPPAGIRATDDDGRTFYNGPDRVPLAEGGYAAVPAGTALRWHETTDVNPDRAVVAGVIDATEDSPNATEDSPNATEDSPNATGDSSSATEDSPNATGDEERMNEGTEPWLVLTADGEPIVGLEGVDALACPSRERFPYNYERDRDKQIRVRDFAGRPVDRYTGIGAMREAGFQPVPAPLVPDHMFDDVTNSWTVVVAE